MNPYEYPSFENDMKNAAKEFIQQTDYHIHDVDKSSITLSNGKRNIMFYLEATTLCSELKSHENQETYALYELFEKGNIMAKYPFDKENKYSYEKWNQVLVKKLLNILNGELKKYI